MKNKKRPDTSMRIHKKTLKLLSNFKEHPRETYEEVIIGLIKLKEIEGGEKR